ncbi:hypothetical protein ACPB9E_17760 [Streptomyces exfoliatus]|uniref:hypothetical protein n=1 Tax=Streptomyces exfoliatus TaxID=1905 RepID=UPI003C2FDB8D
MHPSGREDLEVGLQRLRDGSDAHPCDIKNDVLNLGGFQKGYLDAATLGSRDRASRSVDLMSYRDLAASFHQSWLPVIARLSRQ